MLNERRESTRQCVTMKGSHTGLDSQNRHVSLARSRAPLGTEAGGAPNDRQVAPAERHAALPRKRPAAPLVCHERGGGRVRSDRPALQKAQRRVRPCRLSCRHDGGRRAVEAGSIVIMPTELHNLLVRRAVIKLKQPKTNYHILEELRQRSW